MKAIDWRGNSRVYKIELGDMLPGEVFYLVGGFEPCMISPHDYTAKCLRESVAGGETHIEFWYWHNSPTHGQRRVYHVSAEVIPANVERVINRCLARKRADRKRASTV